MHSVPCYDLTNMLRLFGTPGIHFFNAAIYEVTVMSHCIMGYHLTKNLDRLLLSTPSIYSSICKPREMKGVHAEKTGKTFMNFVLSFMTFFLFRPVTSKFDTERKVTLGY